MNTQKLTTFYEDNFSPLKHRDNWLCWVLRAENSAKVTASLRYNEAQTEKRTLTFMICDVLQTDF